MTKKEENTPASTLHCFVYAVRDVINHDGVEHAGYISFLTFLALFPFLVFFVSLIGFMEHLHIGQELVGAVSQHLPEHILIALRPRMEEIINGPPQGLLTLAIIGTIWTSSSAVQGLRTILNRAYRVGTPPSFLWTRFLSILQLIGFTFASMLAMAVLILSPLLWHHLEKLLAIGEETPAYWGLLHSLWTYGMSGTVLFLVVSLSYFVIPNVKQGWRSVFPGALLVVFLWVGAAAGLSEYIKRFDQINVVYGSLGGVIIALLFFYILSLIYIFGAEFNYFYDLTHGHTIEEKEHVDDDACPPEPVSTEQEEHEDTDK